MEGQVSNSNIFTYNRLEDEGNSNQKLMAERSAADTKIKGLEEQLTLSEDNISKVTGLAKALGLVDRMRREKDLATLTITSNSTLKENIITHQPALSYKIFSLSHAVGKGKCLDFKIINCDSNEILAEKFIEYLAVDCGLKGAGSLEQYKRQRVLCAMKDLTKYFASFVLLEATTISQAIFDSKKLYEFHSKKLVGDAVDGLESKIKLTFAPVFKNKVI